MIFEILSTNVIKRTFTSLRHRNFRLFFSGQSVSLIGTWMQQTALSWLIYDLTGSKFLLGFIATIGTLPMMFLSFFGGVIADKCPKRKVLIIVQSLAMIFAFILGSLVFFNTIKIWHIMLFAVLSGIVFSVDMPVRQSFFIDIVDKKDLMNAVALNSSIVNAARILGPAVGGIVMLKMGISFCFILNGLSFLAVIMALYNINAPEIKPEKTGEPIGKFMVEGFRYVKNHRLILNLMLMMIVIGIFGWSYSILFPAIARDFFHKGEAGYAVLVSANGLGSLIAALSIAYLGNTPKKRQFVNWGIYLFSIVTALLAFCRIYWMDIILITLAGVGLLMYFSSTTTLIQSNVDDTVRGRVMGIWAFVFGGMAPLGSFFAGTYSQFFGIKATLITSSIICSLFTLFISVFSQPKEPKLTNEKKQISV